MIIIWNEKLQLDWAHTLHLLFFRLNSCTSYVSSPHTKRRQNTDINELDRYNHELTYLQTSRDSCTSRVYRMLSIDEKSRYRTTRPAIYLHIDATVPTHADRVCTSVCRCAHKCECGKSILIRIEWECVELLSAHHHLPAYTTHTHILERNRSRTRFVLNVCAVHTRQAWLLLLLMQKCSRYQFKFTRPAHMLTSI